MESLAQANLNGFQTQFAGRGSWRNTAFETSEVIKPVCLVETDDPFPLTDDALRLTDEAFSSTNGPGKATIGLLKGTLQRGRLATEAGNGATGRSAQRLSRSV